MVRKPSKSYIRLTQQLPDLEEHIKQGNLNVVPIPKNKKYPLITNWNARDYSLTESFTYTNKGGKQTQKGLQYHTGNYGIIIGYGNSTNGYSIGCIDIDGYKTNDDNPDLEIKKTTQEYIYNCLKDIPNSIQVKTQSGGYHIYLWTEKTQPDTSITSNSLYYPKDFKIKSLAGKCLNDSIEIFTNQDRKQTVLPGSTIYNKATKEIREYKVISTVNKFSDIDKVQDLNQLVIDTLVSKGYTYKPGNQNETKTVTNSQVGTGRSKPKSKLKKLSQEEITQIVQLVTPVFPIIEGKKHTGAMYLGGYFSYHITKDSSREIANGIVKEIGNIFDDSQEFINTVLKNYDRQVTKAGLPKLCKLIQKRDSTFNTDKFTNKLNSICNSSITKELVSTVMIDDNQIPIYLYEDDKTKWLRYKGIFNGIDLILNLNTLIGSFKDNKTNKEITSFNFKFKNKSFDIKKTDLESISYFLGIENKDLKLPKFFTGIIKTSINNMESHITNPKELSKEVELKQLFISRNKEGYARKELGNYLHKHGTILRRGINTPYILNKKTNGYDSVETDDILEYLYSTNDFELNTIHTDDINKALGFISERMKPSYNIVKFPNCLYDMENFTVIDNPEKPILTLTEVQYNYNPEAKGKLIVEFLETSLRQKDDDDKKVQERVQGFYEMIGYLLTSGNSLNAWFILTGKAGAGKGTTANIITNIFGNDKIGHLQLQELKPDNNFATSHLVSKQVNIVTDSPTKPIEDKGLLKSITGYDDIPIEFKGKDKSILPKEEVPDMVTVCNNIPRFKDGFDDTIVQRAIIFHYPNQFRGTDEQKPILKEIEKEPQEMEFLLYQSIQAYRDMVINGRDFKARISEAKTMELLGKHTDPIGYILQKLIRYNENTEEDGEEPILRDELNKLIVFIANKEGINLPNLKNGLITPQTLINTVRREFGLDKDYKIKPLATTYNEYTQKYDYERGLPDFCKTPEYDEYLNEMEGNQKE